MYFRCYYDSISFSDNTEETKDLGVILITHIGDSRNTESHHELRGSNPSPNGSA